MTIDAGARDLGFRYLDLWIRQRHFEFAFVYDWLEPWVDPAALVSDEPAAAREMFARFWVQSLFQAASDESNHARLRALRRRCGLRELRRTVLSPDWCAANFDPKACAHWRDPEARLVLPKRKESFLDACGVCAAREGCPVLRSVVHRNRTLPISIGPSVLMLRWKSAPGRSSPPPPPAMRLLASVGDYDPARHRLRDSVPGVKESVYGFLMDVTDPLLSPLTSRLAAWHVPTAGKFMELWVGRMPGIPAGESGRIAWLTELKRELDDRRMAALDDYLEAASRRLPAFGRHVDAARDFLRSRGMSLRFLTHIIWNGGMGRGEDRPEIADLCRFLRDGAPDLEALEGGRSLARDGDPRSLLDGFLLRHLRPLSEYPKPEAAQVRAFLSRHWGSEDAAFLIEDLGGGSTPVARLLTMTAQWTRPQAGGARRRPACGP